MFYLLYGALVLGMAIGTIVLGTPRPQSTLENLGTFPAVSTSRRVQDKD
jgi:hypothetical protein